jgi:hypothetical protein
MVSRIGVWVVVSRIAITTTITIWVAVISIPALWISIRFGCRFGLSLGYCMYHSSAVGIVSGQVIPGPGVCVRMVAIVTIGIRMIIRMGIDEWLDLFLFHLWLLDYLSLFLSLWQGGVDVRVVVVVQSSIVVGVWVCVGIVVILWISFGFRLCYCESKKSENYNEFHGGGERCCGWI